MNSSKSKRKLKEKGVSKMFDIKRVIFTMLIVLICGFAYSQSGYVFSMEPVSEFSEYFASNSIFLCSDKSVVTIGEYDSMDSYNPSRLWFHDSVIIKLDPAGNLFFMPWTDYHSIIGVDIDAEDTVTYMSRYSYNNILLMSVDSDGVTAPIADAVSFPNKVIAINKALRTPNNEIVAVGKVFQGYNPQTSSAIYVRFSATGEVLTTALWPILQESLPGLNAEAYDLALMDNGNILIACRFAPYNGSILETQPDGTIVNQYDIPGENQSFNIVICPEPNKPSYIIAYRMGAYPDYSIHIDRFENTEFEPLFTIANTYLQDINSMILGTDNIYLCGYSRYAGTYGAGVLLSMNYDGAINRSWEQEGDNICHAMPWEAGIYSPSPGILALDDEGCIYWAWGNRGAQVITKLLPNGQLPIDDEVQAPPLNIISAYPNPMKDEITIKINQDDLSPAAENKLNIFNINGQLIRSLKLTKDETVWDGKNSGGKPCPKGIYLLRYQYGTSHVTKICKTR